MDTVLTASRPTLSGADAVAVARACFGVSAATARDLGSERDRTFALDDAGGQPVAILKVSNASEDPEVLDMEAAVALHVMASDPGLRVAVPWRPERSDRGAAEPARPGRPGDEVADLRARWSHGEAAHWVRLYDVLPGNSRIEAARLSDAALIAWGDTTARLDQALRGFAHPRAQRMMLWDVQHALASRVMLGDIRDRRQRELVAGVLDEFERTVTPVWPRLRAQVAHTDLSVDNTVTDDAGFITGIIDFGDMSHTALITELASVLDSLGVGREGDELFRLARLVLDGYQRRTELEELELEVLGVMWAARSAVTIAISSWRVARGLEEQAFAERYNAECARMLDDDAGRRVARAGPSARRRRGRSRAAVARWRSGERTRSGPRWRRCSTTSPSRWLTPRACGSPTTDGGRLPRRLQQRALRGSWPPARDRRHRPPEPADQHAHALPAPGRDRAGRAARGPVPAGARHGAAGQLRL